MHMPGGKEPNQMQTRGTLLVDQALSSGDKFDMWVGCNFTVLFAYLVSSNWSESMLKSESTGWANICLCFLMDHCFISVKNREHTEEE